MHNFKVGDPVIIARDGVDDGHGCWIESMSVLVGGKFTISIIDDEDNTVELTDGYGKFWVPVELLEHTPSS
jgi:hypothetical protein